MEPITIKLSQDQTAELAQVLAPEVAKLRADLYQARADLHLLKHQLTETLDITHNTRLVIQALNDAKVTPQLVLRIIHMVRIFASFTPPVGRLPSAIKVELDAFLEASGWRHTSGGPNIDLWNKDGGPLLDSTRAFFMEAAIVLKSS